MNLEREVRMDELKRRSADRERAATGDLWLEVVLQSDGAGPRARPPEPESSAPSATPLRSMRTQLHPLSRR
jgi:hypothetical protein